MNSLHVVPAILETNSKGTKVTPLAMEPTDSTVARIINALGGEKSVEALPVLDLSKCLHRGGGTGYIDFVQPEDMTASVMRGKDEHGRPFVALRLEYRGEVRVETIFRRYTSGSTWTSGGASFICAGAMTSNDIEFLGRLVRKEQVGRRMDASYKVGCAEDWSEHNRQDIEKAGNDRNCRRLVVDEPDKNDWVYARWERGDLSLV